MDKRAVKILLDSFWSTAGWKPDIDQGPSAENLEYAKSKGLMFDPVRMDHSELLTWLSGSLQQLSRQVVADAFLASLSTRRLDWRSALGSFAVFQHVPSHCFEGKAKSCAICGVYCNVQTYDLNVLNFGRWKWGGVRHDQVVYAAMDLGLFLKEKRPCPTAEDVQIFRDIISALSNAPPNVTSAALHSYFPKSLRANKAERDVVVGILGYCGILATHMHPGFSDCFVPIEQRHLPDRRFVDMAYPSCWWSGSDGVNQERLLEYFGNVL